MTRLGPIPVAAAVVAVVAATTAVAKVAIKVATDGSGSGSYRAGAPVVVVRGSLLTAKGLEMRLWSSSPPLDVLVLVLVLVWAFMCREKRGGTHLWSSSCDRNRQGGTYQSVWIK